ncbi:ABC transporter ATP-binding protein/permease [Amylibacter sp.]|nr:ABC transporter ATP-binding protein/permease [Amylibacter sp.]
MLKNYISLANELWSAFEHKKGSALLLLFMIVISSFLDAISIGFLLPVMEVIIEGNTDNSYLDHLLSKFNGLTQEKTLVIVLGIFLLLILIKNIIIYLKNRIMANLLFGLRGYWTSELMNKYLHSNYNFILNSKQGTLINNVLVETEKAQICLKFLVQFVSAAILSTFMVGVLYFISWQMTTIMLLVMVLVVFIFYNLVGAYTRKVGAEKLKYAKSIGNQVSESIIAIKQIKTLSMEGRISKSFSGVVDKYVKTLSDFRVNSSLPKIISEVLVVFLLVMIVFCMINFTNYDIKNLVPIIAIFIVVGNRVAVQASLLTNSSMHILSNWVSLKRIYGLVKDDVGREVLEEGSVFEAFNCDIVFKNVSFSYGADHKVFEQLNFKIPKGKFVFLIGESGSGKSTLVDLLLLLQAPQSGSIVAGANDLSKINIKSWRSNIGYVSQDILLFNKSIRENIRDGKCSATDREVEEICKLVNANEFIQRLPNGYETNVGDRGAKLSGGQSQRLALARSMLHDPNLLIFDEATSAMDQKLEEKIIQEIKLNSAGKTVLFITHRLATAVHADVIYRLAGGKITTLSRTDLNNY